MVNYILSFCKITSASRIFSRNFYLPLLKPQTPKDALRTFRITGKWLLGGKIQHYIPVLLNHRKKRGKWMKNFGKKIHKENDDYTYMTPILDSENETHQLLLTILDRKKCVKNHYVYTVDDKKYNIVLQGELETAILDGDVIDVLVSQRNDKIIVKLNTMKKIPIEIQYFDDDTKLYCGEGATTPEDEKFHHHGKYTMSIAKIFEEKEMEEEKWEEELRRILRKKRRQKKEGSKEWKAMMEQSIKNLNWTKFEEDAKKVIDEIDEPALEQDIEMEVANLETTQNVNDLFLKKGVEMLPTLTEIPDIIKGMSEAILHEIDVVEDDGNTKTVTGVKVKLPSGKECFVSGQMVRTEDGDVFIPGQTIENEYGLEYSPGITITIDNKPTLISGLIMGEEEREPMFLPTESTITADGQLTFATTEAERPILPPERKKTKIVPEEDDHHSTTSEDFSSIELNSSEIEEFDTTSEKQEQERLELEKLKAFLLDDGLDDVLLSIEEKRRLLKEKLEELKKLSVSNENSLVSYVSESDGIEVASKITSDTDTQNRLSDIFITMTRRVASFRDKNRIHSENIPFNNTKANSLKIMLKTAFVAAVDVFKTRPKDQSLAFGAITEILVDVLKKNPKTLEELLELMNTPNKRLEICDNYLKELTQSFSDSKISFLHNLPKNAIENIEKILKKDSEIKCEAFIKIAKAESEIIEFLVKNLSEMSSSLKCDNDAIELLETAITKAVKEFLKKQRENIDVSCLKNEALAFAKALSLDKIEDVLCETTSNLNHDSRLFDFLERVILIRLLAQRDYSLKTAIERIQKNPERARADPRIRQLIRESGVLVSNSIGLKSSREIPFQLLKTQNLLAIEDLLVQKSKIEFPVMVTRKDLQAVIPKEALRGVESGRVSYVLLNESGVMRINSRRASLVDSLIKSDKEDGKLLYAKSNVRKMLNGNSRQVA